MAADTGPPTTQRARRVRSASKLPDTVIGHDPRFQDSIAPARGPRLHTLSARSAPTNCLWPGCCAADMGLMDTRRSELHLIDPRRLPNGAPTAAKNVGSVATHSKCRTKDCLGVAASSDRPTLDTPGSVPPPGWEQTGPPSTAVDVRPTKICADCAETVLADARTCRFCGYEFDVAEPPRASRASARSAMRWGPVPECPRDRRS